MRPSTHSLHGESRFNPTIFYWNLPPKGIQLIKILPLIQVKRYSYTENATSPLALWYIERNCSAKCEPGCLILGERTKVNPIDIFTQMSWLIFHVLSCSFTPVSPAVKRNSATLEMAPTTCLSTTDLLLSFSFRFSSKLSRAPEKIHQQLAPTSRNDSHSTWWR